MLKELVWKSIKGLKIILERLENNKIELNNEILIIKKDKNRLYNEISIINNWIEWWNKKFNEINNINHQLIIKNNKKQDDVILIDNKLARLHKKELEYLWNIEKTIEKLNTLDLKHLNLKDDIVNLESDKHSLINVNSGLNIQNQLKRNELEDINKNITEKTIQSDNINNSIQDFRNKELELKNKENILLQKITRLNKKEIRLNDLKKYLLSKK